MGEYANHKGTQIKIATCEEFFVMPSILEECTPLPNSFAPNEPRALLIGRFPLPESLTSAISSAEHQPAISAYGNTQKHDTVYLYHPTNNGLRITLPCTMLRESTPYQKDGLSVTRDQFGGARHGFKVTAFGIRENQRALILSCTTCGARWHVRAKDTPEQFLEAVDLLSGDLVPLENEWRALERMLGLSTRGPVRPESEVLPEGANIVLFPA